MAFSIKANRSLRVFLQWVLGKKIAVRHYPNSQLRIMFPAAKQLSLYFSRTAVMEPIITDNFRRIIGVNDLIYDVGANIGYFTLLFRHWATNGKVVAFEPDPNNLNFLESNIKLNKFDQIKIIPKAVSDRNGRSEFYLDLNTGRTSSIVQGVFHPVGMFGLKRINVQTTTCDLIAEIEGFPNVIKCDIEGHETAFLKGATNILSKRPIIMIEVQAVNYGSIEDILHPLGYRFYDAQKPLTAESDYLKSINVENVFAIHEEKYYGLFHK
jgi:FkbM family methyltransferase